MFGFLKEKLKSAVSIFTKKIDETIKEIEPVKETKKKNIEKPVEKINKTIEKTPETEQPVRKESNKINKPVQETIKEKVNEKLKSIAEEKRISPDKEPETSQQLTEQPAQIIPEKKSFFAKIKEKITYKKLDDNQFESLFWDLELALLENNVAFEVIEKIKEDLKINLVNQPIKRNHIEETILNSLKTSLEDVLQIPKFDIIKEIKNSSKPYIICFFGINGSGKTTSIAKFAYLLRKNNFSVVLAAADTFRAAAIDQLEEHANNLTIKMVKHDYGSDSAAVAFDAVKYAKAHNIDVVLIDTAGRMHSNANLMDELKKIVKVVNPNLNIFVGESVTGNDCIEQAQRYDIQIGIQGIILTKADVDDKGGTPISISYVTKKPILYLGTGQSYDDLKPFDKNQILQKIFEF
ncbi:signal recognition particle-docking protein FtsY [Candidatus Woesearchaeota archaeon]|nr:signal recognition particle-docking protein FtsY [Candidatus Woesearchaeota archaeon]